MNSKTFFDGEVPSSTPKQKGGNEVVPQTQNSTKQKNNVGPKQDAQSAPPKLDPLVAIQRKFCLINLDGKIWVIDKSTLNTLTDQGTLEKLKLSNRLDGKLLIKRLLKSQYPESDAKQIAEEFWESPQTVLYNGVEFNPKGPSKGYLNLWKGPTIKPSPGDWSLIKEFLFEIICNEDDEAYDYLIRYIAHALQKPDEKPGVIIILLGGQGIGKGTLGKVFKRIWSATYIHVHNINSVTGDFNAALERTFMVFMDEALFAGDRRAADALKSLVTEEFIHVNEKFQPARQIRSYHRFIAATNADHFKKTERDDRRDFTLRVSESHKGDHTFWNDLNHKIDNGGVEAMVQDLLEMDLSQFNVREKPNTKEFLQQKLHSLGPIGQWWHDCLLRGTIKEYDENWHDFVSTSDALEGIKEVAGGRTQQNLNMITVKQELKKLCPSAENRQKQMRGDRQRGLSLPDLKQARTEFEEYIAGTIEWPNVLSADVQSGGDWPEGDF